MFTRNIGIPLFSRGRRGPAGPKGATGAPTSGGVTIDANGNPIVSTPTGPVNIGFKTSDASLVLSHGSPPLPTSFISIGGDTGPPGSVDVGHLVSSGEYGTVVGNKASSDSMGTSLGYQASGVTGSVSVGYQSSVSSSGGVAVGAESVVHGPESGVAIGYRSESGGTGTAIGNNSHALQGVAIGDSASTQGQDVLALPAFDVSQGFLRVFIGVTLYDIAVTPSGV